VQPIEIQYIKSQNILEMGFKKETPPSKKNRFPLAMQSCIPRYYPLDTYTLTNIKTPLKTAKTGVFFKRKAKCYTL
jgi:hypothetical protein